MAVEYLLNYDCAVKQELGGAEGFLQLLKDAGRADALSELAKADPDEYTDDTVFTFARQDARGRQVQEQLTLREIRERGSRLAGYEGQCRDCPANVFQAAGGCSGAINYPISAKAEQWLLSCLPDDLEDSVRGKLVKAFIKDFSRNGRIVDANRRDGSLYESRKPLLRTWGSGWFGKTKCTSSVLLGNLYHVGEVQPYHGALMAYFLGAVDEMPAPDRSATPEFKWNVDQLPDDPSTRQIASMFRVLYRGYTLDVSTYVEP